MKKHFPSSFSTHFAIVSRGEMSIEPSTPISASTLCGAACFIFPPPFGVDKSPAPFRSGRIVLDWPSEITLYRPSLSAYGLASRQGLFS
jgi:hypothetical protein